MLKLTTLTEKDYDKYQNMRQEWVESNTYLCPDLLEDVVENKEQYSTLLQKLENKLNGEHEDLDWYQFGHYFIIQEDDEFIGAVAIRENLTELGDRIWGNIALGIRPSKRRQGYARKSLELTIEKCKELGMNRITACHYIENKVSPKLIKSCGGVYEDTVISEYSGKEIKRYHF